MKLISCHPDSNRNLVGEFVLVSGNWLADELPCPLSLRDIGRYRVPLSVLILMLLPISLTYVLTSHLFEFLQKGKDSSWTLGSCT